MKKNYRIKYLRRGEWTWATGKTGDVLSFDSIYDTRMYLVKARDKEPNNPVTFMNRVNICEFDGDNFVCKVEEF